MKKLFLCSLFVLPLQAMHGEGSLTFAAAKYAGAKLVGISLQVINPTTITFGTTVAMAYGMNKTAEYALSMYRNQNKPLVQEVTK